MSPQSDLPLTQSGSSYPELAPACGVVGPEGLAAAACRTKTKAETVRQRTPKRSSFERARLRPVRANADRLIASPFPHGACQPRQVKFEGVICPPLSF